jgi:hypothetical protein
MAWKHRVLVGILLAALAVPGGVGASEAGVVDMSAQFQSLAGKEGELVHDGFQGLPGLEEFKLGEITSLGDRLSSVSLVKGDTHVFLFVKAVEGGHATRRVLASLAFRLRGGPVVWPCSLASRNADYSLVTVAKDSPGAKGNIEVLVAWRFDVPTKTVKVVPKKTVRCSSEDDPRQYE